PPTGAGSPNGSSQRIRADFDGDGKADVFWHNDSTGENVIWLMNGVNMKGGAFIPAISPGWQAVGSGDLNGDGRADLIFHNPSTGENVAWLMSGFSRI